MKVSVQKPTYAFVAASWSALFIGIITYLVGLWNAGIQLNEKGYYFIILMYGLFAAVSLQKSVRDKIEDIPVTGIYYIIAWASLGMVIVLLSIGLWNANLALSEKGFFAMSFVLSLFSVVAVQKNVRDLTITKYDVTPVRRDTLK